ncbi:MAG: hypoxanthine-guanine phosphoribosyltransferase [Halothiobacillaceae bacterium]
MTDFAARAHELEQLRAHSECLIDPQTMDTVYARMAEQIRAQLADRLPVALVIMNGGLVSAGKLLQRMDFPLELSYLHATRYRGGTEGGALRWVVEPQVPLAGRDVLIIDDIFDEGYTLKAVRDWVRDQGPAGVWVAVTTDKRHDRKVEGIVPDFVGIDVPDRYIFGEGMDYCGYFRNLNGIYALREQSPDAGT